jgi:hypothetical protein
MSMSNRTAKFVSAVFAGFLAGAPLSTVSHGATPAAEDCLAGPKDQAPQGSHWYYHIDHATKRHCWYLKGEREALSQAAPPNSPPSAQPDSPKAEAAMQRSIADAHAELPAAQTSVEQDTGPTTPPPGDSPAANAVGIGNSPAADAADTNPQQSVVAGRWPDPSDVNSQAAAPTTGGSGVAMPAQSGAASQPGLAALAAADASPEPSESQSGSIRALLMAMIGALSLAGILAGAIFKFVNAHSAAQRGIRTDRRAIWDSAGSERPSPAAYPNAAPRMRATDFPRELRMAEDPDHRFTEMLARLSRSPTS